MNTERWLPIAGFDGYEISSMGRVRRGDAVKKARPDRKGYLSVTLWWHGKSHTRFVQRLVAEAFIGPRPDGMVVRHRNGINDDNQDTNLMYGTSVENEADKIGHGTQLRGSRHHQSKLTENQVLEIRRRYKSGDSVNGGSALAKEFGVSDALIHYIAVRKLWAHLADQL